MEKRISYWIELENDAEFIKKIRSYGLSKLCKVLKLNNPTITRWLNGSIGMKEEWYRMIIRRVKNVKSKDDFVTAHYNGREYIRRPPTRSSYPRLKKGKI